MRRGRGSQRVVVAALAAGLAALGLAAIPLVSIPASAAGVCGATGVLSTDGHTCTYTTAGEDLFTVPPGVMTLTVVAVGARGAAGGNNSPYLGGLGALGAK